MGKMKFFLVFCLFILNLIYSCNQSIRSSSIETTNNLKLNHKGLNCRIELKNYNYFVYWQEEESTSLLADWEQDTLSCTITYKFFKVDSTLFNRRSAYCNEINYTLLVSNFKFDCLKDEYKTGLIVEDSVEYYYSNICNSYVASCIAHDNQMATILIPYAYDLNEIRKIISCIKWE